MDVNFKNHKFKASEHYAFLLHPEVPAEWADMLPGIAESRWHEILKLLSIEREKMQWGSRYTYVVEINEKSRRSEGHVYPSLIRCIAQRQSDLTVPFIHEEAHAVVYRYWGRLPGFWAEGFADYTESRLRNPQWDKPHQNNMANVLNFVLKFLDSGRNDILYSSNDMEFWDLRKKFIVAYVVASHCIHYIVQKYGSPFLHGLMQILGHGEFENMESELKRIDFFEGWRQFVLEEQGLLALQDNIRAGVDQNV